MKIITDFGVLMRLASAVGKAKLSGNKKAINIAQERHDSYKKICLESYEMQTDFTSEVLYNGFK